MLNEFDTLKLKKFALKLTKNIHDAEDLYMDVMLKFYKDTSKYDSSKGGICAFLFTVMKNIHVDGKRGYKGRAKHLDISEFADKSCDRNVINDLLFEDIMGTLGSLDFYGKYHFILRLNGYSYKEIAEITDDNISTVKTSIFRCKKELQQKLKLIGINRYI